MTTADKVIGALGAYQVKSEGAGKWRSNSPFRPGANSHSFTLKVDADGEHGAYFDHRPDGGTHNQGTLYELAEKLGIEVPTSSTTRIPVVTSKRAYTSLEDYAAHKGVEEGVFVEAGWKQVIRENRLALEFPTKSGPRWRFLDGSKPYFKSSEGYKRCWYGLQRASRMARDKSIPLVICNGEPSVVIAHHFNVPACCVTSGEKGHIPDDLISELKAHWQGMIFVALDCDEAGQVATKGMVAQLGLVGYQVRGIDLLLGDSGDLADFCKLHTNDSAAGLVKLAALKPKPSTTVDSTGEAERMEALRKELARARVERDDQRLDRVIEQISREVARLESRRLSDPLTMVDVTRQVRDDLEDRRAHPGRIQYPMSRIYALDDLTGGFPGGKMYTLLGETGMKKTWAATSIAAGLAFDGPGLVVCTEMMPRRWLARVVALLSRVSLSTWSDCSAECLNKIEGVLGWLADSDQHITMLPDTNPNPKAVLEHVRAHQESAEHKYKWVVIDSLSNLGSTSTSDIFDRTTQAADCALELACMGLTVVCTSQIGREKKDKQDRRPRLHDAKGSGRVEENSDIVLGLYDHGELMQRGLVELHERSKYYKEGHVMFEMLKNREYNNEGTAAYVQYIAGCGFYSERPATVGAPVVKTSVVKM